ncbi:hypothetical protein IE81DRAFT_336260 [Ceraceosorus guamensis]|uniref:LrgB-domain-containing protein n=1 Tax=Ceraceosorus guamensis TaxID=1522189 RepID=A0A316W6C7_9BASI|nr:hypothetical protein IE81DRAFT_336260 [Ceraceosorus guamensis]PWN45476.1 hypothetical protein IE81DRAFT_336260 [Ceraceosorus guamensis]
MSQPKSDQSHPGMIDPIDTRSPEKDHDEPVEELSPARPVKSDSSDKDLKIVNSDLSAQPRRHSRRGSAASRRHSTALAASETSPSICESCGEDKIHGWRDVVEACSLSWHQQRKHLFTSWIHVPLGVTFLLVVVWGLKLAIDVAPFRFPAAVLAAFGIFLLLLLLDWLSSVFPGRRQRDAEAMYEKSDRPQKKRKRFIDPVLMLLAPPCDFCLRIMSVLFTPSFILIPAREVISGGEIGRIIGWFAATQVLAFLFPIYLNKGINWAFTIPKQLRERREKAQPPLTDLRRSSTVNGRRSRRGSTMSQSGSLDHRSRRGSTATIAGLEFEKGYAYSGQQRLGTIASGLAGVTATITAPVAHIDMTLEDDEQAYYNAVAIEQARQQGDPAVTSPNLAPLSFGSFVPHSDVSYFSHARMPVDREGRPRHHHHAITAEQRRNRSRSRDGARSQSRPATARSLTVSPRVPSGGGSVEYGPPSVATVQRSATAVGALPVASPAPSEAYRFPSTQLSPVQTTIAFDQDLPTAASLRAAENGARAKSNAPAVEGVREPEPAKVAATSSASSSRRPSLLGNFIAPLSMSRRESATSGPTPVATSASSQASAKDRADQAAVAPSASAPAPEDQPSEYGPDAIERLASWISDLITPIIYFTLIIIGLPLFFVLNFALPLYLGINLLAFIGAITIVPPKIRRFLHPILSTSIVTVLLIWALGAMKGLSIKQALALYSNGAKYTVLWDPTGYQGPVPGAGDILFSVLDAGIVSLAIPMYRYRKDLKQNFWRMLIALTPCAALSLFLWPYIAYLMGMNEVHALAFSARFMSTPLAIELANNIGADESITIVLVCVTGIIYAIVKEYVFKWTNVKDDMTVGVAMGSTAGAIGASSLISKPRQLALASLCFILFGAIMLIATAIPPVVDAVRMLAAGNNVI